MDLQSLPTVAVLSDCVTIAQKDQVKIVRIQHDKASAGIALHGGHVVSYQPAGKEDLIWMSEQAIFDGKAALRGGIPVCWPWFGRIAAPAHGFARSSEWELIEHRENEHGVIVELALFASEQTHDIWPHMFDTRLVVEVGDELKVSLKILNIDDEPFTFSGALHTYLNVGHIDKVVTSGMGPEYIDGLLENQVCQGGDTLIVDKAIDRVYTNPESDIVVRDAALDRELKVTNSGHNSAVIWNPWQQGAEGMADMQDDGYQTMICIESTVHADSIDKGVTLAPDEAHTLTTVISA